MLEAVRVFLDLSGPSDWAWLAVSVAIFVLSVVAFRRRHCIDTLLLLIGSSAFLAKHLFWDVFMLFLLGYCEHSDSAFVQIFYPGCHASAQWTSNLAVTLLGISLLFPIGVVVFLVNATRTHLTRRWSERLAASAPRLP
jgi:hypothetical protein